MRSRKPEPPIATIGDLLRAGDKWAWVNCNNRLCMHRVAMPFAPFAIRWGLDAPAAPTFRKAFRCSRCGGKASTLTLASYSVLTHTTQAYPADRSVVENFTTCDTINS